MRKKYRVLFYKNTSYLADYVDKSPNIKLYTYKFKFIFKLFCPDVIIIDFKSYIEMYRYKKNLNHLLLSHKTKPLVIAYKHTWNQTEIDIARYRGINIRLSCFDLLSNDENITNVLKSIFRIT